MAEREWGEEWKSQIDRMTPEELEEARNRLEETHQEYQVAYEKTRQWIERRREELRRKEPAG